MAKLQQHHGKLLQGEAFEKHLLVKSQWKITEAAVVKLNQIMVLILLSHPWQADTSSRFCLLFDHFPWVGYTSSFVSHARSLLFYNLVL